MRSLLGLTVAAFLASTSVSFAGGQTLAAIALDGTCDVFGLSLIPESGILEVHETGTCGTKYGVGVAGASKASNFGRAYVVAVHDIANPDTQYVYTFSRPLLDGGSWVEYSTTDGSSYTLVGSGTFHAAK